MPAADLTPVLQACLQRLAEVFQHALAKTEESAGQLALSALKAARRDELLLVQGLLHQQAQACVHTFETELLRQWDASPGTKVGAAAQDSSWDQLSLVEESAVDALVAADRIGKAIGHGCEWELREVESYTAALLDEPEAGPDRNPLRPACIARAVLATVDALTDQASLRQTLSEEITRSLSPQMANYYAEASALFQSHGLQQQALRALPHGVAPRSTPGSNAHFGAGTGGSNLGNGIPGGGAGGGPGGGVGSGAGSMVDQAPRTPGLLGRVDAGMMGLLRQLASLPVALLNAGAASGAPGAASPTGTDLGADGLPLAPPTNLISLHRSALREATQAPLDHMVIDVVAGLFDAILADPKVPPQMARLLARLQLPVLRAALGDSSFFSKRKHPVRRFINRLATLACAFEDYAHEPGAGFLRQVTELVEHIAAGDFERVDLYEKQLDTLETWVRAQSRASVAAAGPDPTALLERKDAQARKLWQYRQQLTQALSDIPMPDFVRQFITQDWSTVIVQATEFGGEALEHDMRKLGKSLAQSVLPKGGSPAKREFIAELPQLVRGINQGLDRIGSPEAVRKKLFADLLPVHAESLKTPALSPLDHNLLVKRLEVAFGLAVPDELSAQRATAAVDIDLGSVMGAADAQAVGWLGEADTASGPDTRPMEPPPGESPDEAPVHAADLQINGLPQAEEPVPTRGAALFEHLELGNTYRLHTPSGWHKVRLSHIGGHRSFFIFTEGESHPKTVTMTARVLRKLCENDRLRAFEGAQLLERATVRARQQLAALLPGGSGR